MKVGLTPVKAARTHDAGHPIRCGGRCGRSCHAFAAVGAVMMPQLTCIRIARDTTVRGRGGRRLAEHGDIR